MKKKKLLFYGNCVLSTIGKWLHDNYSDKFEIIDGEECGVHPFHSNKNFAIWMDNIEKQKTYYNCVHEKIKKADYFIFQPIEHSAIDELKTDYLIQNIINNVNIAVPNFRFYPYPTDRYCAIPFVKHIYNNITKNRQEILRYLTQENDPKFKEIVFNEYDKCMIENKRRFDIQSSNSSCSIDMLDFIDKNWKQHQLFGTHNHPIGLYWKELICKLFSIMDEPLDLDKLNVLVYPNKNVIVDLKQFNFINEVLPDLKAPEEIDKKLDIYNLGVYENCELGMIYDPLEQYSH